MRRAGLGLRNEVPYDALDRGIREIFERHYFANNGPLVQQLDARMATACGAPFACAIANEFLATALAARVIYEHGLVLAPEHLPARTIEALRWAGVDVALTDVEPDTFAMTEERLKASLTPAITGIFAVHTFGSMANALELERFAREHHLPLIFDASDALGNRIAGREIGTIGDASIVSMHQDRILNAGEGAAVLCSTEQLWNGLRTIRNFHPGQTFRPIAVRMNGKMAEGPAMLALASLDRLDETLSHNARLALWYQHALRDVKGVSIFQPAGEAPRSGRIVLICDTGVIRDSVAAALVEGGVPHLLVMGRAVELPNRSEMTEADVRAVCETIRAAGSVA